MRPSTNSMGVTPPPSMTNVQWASLVLTDGGWPLSTNNVNFMLQWMASEMPPAKWTGSAGANNPLNNGYGTGGGSGLGSAPDLTRAAQWVVDELHSSGDTGGDAVVLCLQQSAPTANTARAQIASAWSGGHYSAPGGGPGSAWHTGIGDIPTVTSAQSQR